MSSVSISQKSSGDYFVYALVCDGEIGYVGATFLPLHTRLNQHLIGAKLSKTIKDKWINECVANKKEIKIIPIRSGLTVFDAARIERQIIAKLWRTVFNSNRGGGLVCTSVVGGFQPNPEESLYQRITYEDFINGKRRVISLFRTNMARRDQYRAELDGKPWRNKVNMTQVFAELRKAR